MIARYLCPIAECGWHHDHADLEMTAADWRGSTGAPAAAILAREYMDADKIVGAHLATHPIPQWAAEVDAWRASAVQLQRDVTAFVDAMRDATDFDAAMRCFHKFMRSAQPNIDNIQTRLVATAGTV